MLYAEMVSIQPPRSPFPGSDPRPLNTTIVGDGEMAELIRTHDWRSTPLGPIAGWSEDLLCAINLILACPFPSVISWGPEMIQFYNDAYRPLIAEKHPSALGQSAPDCWKEAWHIVGAQIEAVFTHGTTTYQRDVRVPVVREGKLQDIYWTYSYSPIFSIQGEIAGTLTVCQDVTGEIQARRERDSFAEQLEQVLEVTTDSVLSIDRQWRVTYLNRRANAIAAPSGNLLGKDFWSCFPYAVYEGSPYLEHYYRAMDHGVAGEFEAFYPEPLNIWVRVQVRPASEGIILFFRDITEQKRAAAALLQTEKLAAVGRLAASIAHEINNPLESVTNLLYLAHSSEDTSEIHQYLDLAERELRRVSSISNQTLRFHRQSSSPKAVTCEDLFESVLLIFQGRLVNSRIEVTKRKRASTPVLCFDGEIRQVLNNLVGNAIDSMPTAGGRLLLRSRDATHWKTGRSGLVLTVADTGAGISPSVMRKIFEAFFTTKGIGGTGLGLWVCHEIVERHKGVLRVRSRQTGGSSGTVFSLFLPLEAARR